MQKNVSFKKKIIATAIASVAASLSGVSFAQDDAEEIVVTGIRASLISSMNQKRESSGINEMITSEDIGKFPDTNLAESLQRIPGVAINRDSGEGSRVTVRGLGAGYNLVTQNGRTVAKTTGDRSFDFADIPAELIAGVTIHKTADSTVDSGGMGATIDYTSIRPLKSPGQKIVLNAKAISDQSWGGGDTPELFGLYSNTFADDTIGISAAIGYQNRESSFARSKIENGWRSQTKASAVPAGYDYVPNTDEKTVSPGSQAVTWSVPQDIRYQFETAERKRTNGQLVLQWKPIDNITATLDFDKYERTINAQNNEISAWFGHDVGNTANHATWEVSHGVATPTIYLEQYKNADSDVAMAAGQYFYKYTGETTGLNVAWNDVVEGLSLTLDAHHSEAQRTPDSPVAGSLNIGISGFTRGATMVALNGDIMPFRMGGPKATMDDMKVTGTIVGNTIYDNSVDGVKLSGKYELNDNHSIDFGIGQVEVDYRQRSTSIQQNNWGGVPGAKKGDLTPFMQGKEVSALSRFNGSLGNLKDLESMKGVDAAKVLANTYQADMFFAPKASEILLYAQKAYPTIKTGGVDGDCGNAFCASTNYKAGTDRSTTETTQSAFVQYGFHQDALRTNLGLRVEQTDVDSVASNSVYTGTNWASDTEIVLIPSKDLSYVSKSGSYTNLLPSLDASYDLTDDFKIRGGVSKTIARAGYGDIGANVSLGGTSRQTDIFFGDRGNPSLKPYESLNLDFAAEWYYAEGSYVSAGLFHKTVSKFIARQSEVMYGTYAPGTPTLYDPFRDSKWVAEALAADPTADGKAIRAYIFSKYNGQAGIEKTPGSAFSGNIYGTAGRDALAKISMSTPVNTTNKKEVWGLEFAVQHLFGESGYGVQFNATKVDTDSVIDIRNVSQNQTPLTGVGDSANLVGFYDKNGWNIRVAYNWRDRYLDSPNNNQSPYFINEYYQLDIGVSYQVTDYLKVSLDGINVTDNAYENSFRTLRQNSAHEETGARYMLGVGVSF